MYMHAPGSGQILLHIGICIYSWEQIYTRIHSWDVLQLYIYPQASQSVSADMLAEKDAHIAALQMKLQTKTKVGAEVSSPALHMYTHKHNAMV